MESENLPEDLQTTIKCKRCNGYCKYYCKTCKGKFCNKCKSNHEKENADHTIVPYAERFMSNIKCKTHADSIYIYWCDKCRLPACSKCRERHSTCGDLKNIDQVLSQNKENMKERLNKLEDKINEAQEIRQKYKTLTIDIDKRIVNRAVKMKEMLENSERDVRANLKKLKDASLPRLTEQEDIIGDTVAKARQEFEKFENDDTSLLEHMTKTNNLCGMLPDLHRPVYPEYEFKEISEFDMMNIIGKVDEKGELKHKTNSRIGAKESTIKIIPQNEPKEVASEDDFPEKKEFEDDIAEDNVQGEDLLKKPLSLACLKSGEVFTTIGYRQIQRIGTETYSIKLDFDFGDMAKGPEGSTMLSDRTHKSVKYITNNMEVKTLFQLEWPPMGLCLVGNGDVLVTFFDRGTIYQFDRKGNTKCELSQTLSNFKYPYSVAFNSVNNHVYICDKDKKSLDAFGRIIALDQTFKLLYTYVGYEETSNFVPVVVCASNVGHVLVTDAVGFKVHILGKTLMFLGYLKTDGPCNPRGIDVDKDDNVWIENQFGKLKKVKLL